MSLSFGLEYGCVKFNMGTAPHLHSRCDVVRVHSKYKHIQDYGQEKGDDHVHTIKPGHFDYIKVISCGNWMCMELQG